MAVNVWLPGLSPLTGIAALAETPMSNTSWGRRCRRSGGKTKRSISRRLTSGPTSPSPPVDAKLMMAPPSLRMDRSAESITSTRPDAGTVTVTDGPGVARSVNVQGGRALPYAHQDFVGCDTARRRRPGRARGPGHLAVRPPWALRPRGALDAALALRSGRPGRPGGAGRTVHRKAAGWTDVGGRLLCRDPLLALAALPILGLLVLSALAAARLFVLGRGGVQAERGPERHPRRAQRAQRGAAARGIRQALHRLVEPCLVHRRLLCWDHLRTRRRAHPDRPARCPGRARVGAGGGPRRCGVANRAGWCAPRTALAAARRPPGCGRAGRTGAGGEAGWVHGTRSPRRAPPPWAAAASDSVRGHAAAAQAGSRPQPSGPRPAAISVVLRRSPAASALAEFAAIWGLLRYLQRASTVVFIVYRIGLGVVLLMLVAVH